MAENAERNEFVIEVRDLVVEYGSGAKRTRALQGVTFTVEPGECVGFIGANGAGKSTTMKTLMGFIFPTSGVAKMFGEPAGSVESRRRIGYLPEVSLYYPFMKARELLELYGGLQGMSRADLRRRIPETLERVGLGGRGEQLLKNFSKGMQQRVGIAQSIIADPECLIFDELSSGLDPMARHDLRETILEIKRRGRTIFFSSHELSEVETLCDRVIMIHKGRVVTEALVSDLMKPLNSFEITFSLNAGRAEPEFIARMGLKSRPEPQTVVIDSAEDYSRAVTELTSSGGTILDTASKTRSLEDYFIQLVREKEGALNS